MRSSTSYNCVIIIDNTTVDKIHNEKLVSRDPVLVVTVIIIDIMVDIKHQENLVSCNHALVVTVKLQEIILWLIKYIMKI